MNKIKAKLIFTSICAGFTAILMVASSLAWFGKFTSIKTDDDNGVGGGFLTYFDSGVGTERNPFVIATPQHYENMVRLQYEKDGWNEKDYYYQFGRTDSQGNSLGFCEVDENGEIIEGEYTNELDLGGKEFRPLGVKDKPFMQHIDGKNLTVSNFTVVGDGDYDLGIFGYVAIDSSEVYIHDAYFYNFIIDTTGISDASGHNSIHESDDEGFGCVGYLAGHVLRSGVFNNVYVNKCKIDGKAANARTLDSYGYYGKTDFDNTGGGIIHGEDYSFTLNAKEVHDYFSENYDNIKDLPLRSRVGIDEDDVGRHYADYDFPISGEQEWVNERAAHPLSEAVEINNTGTTYTLNGTTTKDYKDRTYSLSTLGYQELKTGEKKEYRLQYKNDSQQLVDLPEDVEVSEDEPSIDWQPNTGEFLRYDNKWIYQYSKNDASKETGEADVKVEFNYGTTVTFDHDSALGRTAPVSVKAIRAYLTVDGQKVMNGDKDYFTGNTGSMSCSKVNTSAGTRRGLEVKGININGLPSTLKLARGTHYFSFSIFITVLEDNLIGSTWHYETLHLKGQTYSFSKSSREPSLTKAIPVLITQSMFEGKESLVFNAPGDDSNTKKALEGSASIDKGSLTNMNVSDTSKYDGKVPPYNPGTSFEKDVYAVDLQTGDVFPFIEKNDDLDIHKRTHEEIVANSYIEAYMKNGEIYEEYDFDSQQVSTPITPTEDTIYSITNVDNPGAFTTGIFYYYNSTFKDDIIDVYEGNGSLYTDYQLTNEVEPEIGDIYYATNTGSYFKFDIMLDDFRNLSVIDKFDYWIAENYPKSEPDLSKKPVYIGNELEDCNYRFKNIDIVGGNVSFTYIDRLYGIPINLSIISLPPETQNTNIVEYPTTEQIDNEEQFYATKNCPGSIVMYVNNSANALDSVDSQIGHVEFTYANMNYRGRSLINLEVPSFKKGSGNFVDIRTMGRIDEGEQAVNFASTFIGDITETGAKKCSYACLDANGKMLGVYDVNGNPGYGFFKPATNEPVDERYSYTPGVNGYANGAYTKNTAGNFVIDREKVRSIATYVIVLGANSQDSNLNTYITEIKFNYKASQGFGGSFGKVGYRSATDTINDTIFNFFIDIPAGTLFSVEVNFNRDNNIYEVKFTANNDVMINAFNYDIDSYKIKFNGEMYEEAVNEIQYHAPPPSDG